MKRFYCKKIVLCLSAHQILAGIWLAGKYQTHLTFGLDQAEQAAFAKFLHENISATFSLIIDVAEEDYQIQHIPHTIGRTKTALRTRKLDQAYRGLAYKSACYYGRAKNQTRSDCYLFTAIRQDKTLQVWTDLLQAADIKLAGVYLLSMLSEVMLRQHAPSIENLLLCERLTSGLRQTFFANGRLQMSRLLSDSAENAEPNFYQAETEKTRLYLVSQRLIEIDSPLHLGALNIKHALGLPLQSIKSTLHIDLSALAKALKLPLKKLQVTPELVHMQLLVNGAKVANLAPSVLTKNYRLDMLKRQLKWMSVLLLLISVCMSTYLYQQGLRQAAEFNKLSGQLVIAKHRYQHELMRSSHLNFDAQKIKTTVELAQQIAALPDSPRHMIQVLSNGFESMTDADLQHIQLMRLDWSRSLDKANIQHQHHMQAWYETALLEGEIVGLDDEDKADKLLQRYIENLRSDTNVKLVETLATALNTEKSSEWQGSTAVVQAKTAQKFKLKVIVKPKVAGGQS